MLMFEMMSVMKSGESEFNTESQLSAFLHKYESTFSYNQNHLKDTIKLIASNVKNFRYYKQSFEKLPKQNLFNVKFIFLI